jgi:hypothetical protein
LISERETFAVRGLPDELTDESKILLAQRLISAGLLVVVE